jgi:SAM-dependent methyltransferase
MLCNHRFIPFKTLDCGCEIEECVSCKVLHKKQICEGHLVCQNPQPDYDYYVRNNNFREDRTPTNRVHTLHTRMILKELEYPVPDRTRVLEIGAGTGRLIPFFLSKGCDYQAVEPSAWAVKYLDETYGVPVFNGRFMAFRPPFNYDLIIAEHVLEHVDDCHAAMEGMVRLMYQWGAIYIVVPDDSDLGNPDHQWYFNEESLKRMITLAGLQHSQVLRKSIVPHEDFLYVIARHPDGCPIGQKVWVCSHCERETTEPVFKHGRGYYCEDCHHLMVLKGDKR